MASSFLVLSYRLGLRLLSHTGGHLYMAQDEQARFTSTLGADILRNLQCCVLEESFEAVNSRGRPAHRPFGKARFQQRQPHSQSLHPKERQTRELPVANDKRSSEKTPAACAAWYTVP